VVDVESVVEKVGSRSIGVESGQRIPDVGDDVRSVCDEDWE
jgi:hypothetical protein